MFFNARASTSPIVMETAEQLLTSEDDRENENPLSRILLDGVDGRC